MNLLKKKKKECQLSSLVVQWLELGAFIARVPGSIPGRGTKIPRAVQCGQKEKKRKECQQPPAVNVFRVHLSLGGCGPSVLRASAGQ